MATATEDPRVGKVLEALGDFVEQMQTVKPCEQEEPLSVGRLILPWRAFPDDRDDPEGPAEIVNGRMNVVATVRRMDEATAIVDRMNALGRSES